MNSKKAVTNLFQKFGEMNILIVGDVMIDSYLWGKVERISPEAPVPIVAVNKRNNSLGGAANVALNIKAMGARPVLCSVIGADEKGEIFSDLIKSNEMFSGGILKSPERITTTKFRVIGNNTQLLRVDEEIETPLNKNDFENFTTIIQNIITNEKIDAIIFQDYDKGVITQELIEKIVSESKEKRIPVIVDPKKRNFKAYKNITLFKPNLKELSEGLDLVFDKNNKEALKNAVRVLHNTQNIKIVMTTLSEEGIYISRQISSDTFEDYIIPAHLRTIADVSGAGDTVVCLAAMCLAVDMPLKKIAAISNIAGGLVCESVGVVPVDRDKLFNEIIEIEL